MEKNPRSQANQGPLLSLRRRQSVTDEAGRSGQQMERARIFALPREPSPSHASSSSCSSQAPLKLPPVHLGQPKAGPKNLQLRTVPEVQPRQPQAAPQGSRSQALSLCGDRLPPLSPLPPVPRPPSLPRLLSPRDNESRGTELGSAGEKGPQPCSPCSPQPYTPLPRVILPRLWVGREDAFYISPSQQTLPVPPIHTGAAAMEHSLRGTAPEKQNKDSKHTKTENSSYKSLFQVLEEFEPLQEDSESEQELSQVEEATEVYSEDSSSDQQLSPVEEDIEVAPEDTTSDKELSPEEEDIEAIPEDSRTDKELTPEEEAIEVTPEDSRSDKELSPGKEAIEVTPEDSRSDKELSPGEEAIEVISADSKSDQDLFQVEEAIVVVPKDKPCDEELSSVEQAIKVGPEDSASDQELSRAAEVIELFPGDSKSVKELSPPEEDHEEEASQGESESDKELPQGDSYKDESLSPEYVKFETEPCFGEDSDLPDMSSWEAYDSKLLSLWEECEQKELKRRALLSDVDRESSLSLELPDLQEMSRHQKVLEWLEPNVLNDYGSEEAEETEACIFQRLSKVKRRKEKLEPRQKELLGTEVAAEAAPTLPSASRALWSPTDSELAAVPPSRATEEVEEPPQALAALRGQPAAPRKRPSRFRRALQALQGLFRWPCLRPRPEE
ncbi:transcription factor TFIIIB component B'' homolog [Oenanthe melanoleuca]|uniref:transcription factor TFIIIB component B'' homolog n=1 Tax=Oenanthe melanoleuca TaxID=2939378 RepID=UPI0024C190D3|nr:transcription factor TFIIIB component B'' homolog [Oenanthe melanoleuca]